MSPIALLIATVVPLIFLYVIRSLDLYGTGSFRTVALCFVWGGVAFGLAYYVNTALLRSGIVPDFQTLSRYAAPFTEEILKALVLLYLVRRPSFTYFVDGAIYGFAAGIGFAVFENYSYLLNSPGANELGTALGRVLSTNLMHATASALVGVALGLSRFERLRGSALYIAGGFAFAVALHMGFNALVNTVQSGALLLYAGAMGFLGALLIGWLIQRGLAESRRWIEEKLGDADRVTRGEANVVQRLADAHEVLAPVTAMFGEKKGEQIEEFLVLQARLGILRKTLDKLSDERLRRATEMQIGQLQGEMDAARRAVGHYCMLSLRTLIPEEASPLWGRLEAQMQERLAAPRPAGGASMWATLGQRTANAKAEASEEPPGVG